MCPGMMGHAIQLNEARVITAPRKVCGARDDPITIRTPHSGDVGV